MSNLTSFNTLAPLIIQSYERYLPSAFDDSLTMLQKVNKIIKHLEDMGLLFGDVITQWNALAEWIESDGINEGLSKRLDEMVADGTFDSIINQSIFTDLNNQISAKASASLTNINYYVSPNGDDSYNGESITPFKTLAKATSMLPDVIRQGHIYTIHLDTGVWNEELTLEHITIQGQLIVKGSTTARENHKVLRVTGESLLGHTVIENITTTVKNASGQSFLFRRCAPYVELRNVKAESDSTLEKGLEGVIGLLADYGSHVYVINSDFSGKRYGMRCNYLSRIFSNDNTGSNNSFGVGARWGGVISLYGTQPTGDTNITSSSGGIVGFSDGGKIGLPAELGLVDVKSENDAPLSIKRYFINSTNLGLTGDIPSGQQLRLRFQRKQDGYHTFKVKYGAQTNTGGSGQSAEIMFAGVLNETNFDVSTKVALYTHLMNDTAFSIVHTGADGIFDIIILPLQAVAGRWAIDLESTSMRRQEAPILQSAVLEVRPA